MKANGGSGMDEVDKASGEAGLLEARQRHVDLAGVQRLRQRAERELEAAAELVAVRRLRGQQREKDLSHDAELIALQRLARRGARGISYLHGR